jgi:hypothetical protein
MSCVPCLGDQLWAQMHYAKYEVYIIYYSSPLCARGFQVTEVFSLYLIFQRMHLASCVTNKNTRLPLVRKRIIPNKRPPNSNEVGANFYGQSDFAWSAQRYHTAVNQGYLGRSRYFFIHVASQLSSRDCVAPVVLGIEPGTSGSVARNSDH